MLPERLVIVGVALALCSLPAIIMKQGSVEDRTIQNQTQRNHEFHVHQKRMLSDV